MKKQIFYSEVEQQLEKLKSQHLIIGNEEEAKALLKLCGYSNLIKGYREPYVIKTNNSINYRSGVSLSQIHSLYLLDKNLRNSVMSAMQDLEEHIKESASSVIAKDFGIDQQDYLAYKNYQNVHKRKYRFTLPAILDVLKQKLNTDKNPIHHYATNYEVVPPWILLKSVFFSTIVNFIDLFKKDQKISLAHSLYTDLNISDEVLCKLMTDTLFMCLDYRNVAAHGGRMYNHKNQYHLHYNELFNDSNFTAPQGIGELLFSLDLLKYTRPFEILKTTLDNELTRHCVQYPQDVTYLGQILNIDIVPHRMVYISEKSNKYHFIKHCSGISNPIELDLEHAHIAGYIPCRRCSRYGE